MRLRSIKRALTIAVLLISLILSGAHAQTINAPLYSELIPTAADVPYDPATDTRESFVAPNGKTVTILVKGPQGTGTYSRPIRAGETPDAYFPAILAEAVAAHAHHVVVPKATYRFKGPELCTDLASAACQLPTSCTVLQINNCAPHWTIGAYPSGQVIKPNSVHDLDIDFSGSTLEFTAPVIGIWILESERLRLRNLTIDWPELPIASLGRIVADPANPGHKGLVLDPSYPIEDRFFGGPVQISAVDPWSSSTTDQPGHFASTADNEHETYFIFDGAPQPRYLGRTEVGVHTFSCKPCHFQNSRADPSCSFFLGCANFDGFTEGERVVVRHYTYNGFAILVNWSNDVDFENVTILTGPGMGFAVNYNGGYRGVRLHGSSVKRAPGRLISTASDAVNVALQADLIVEDGEFADQGDDGININPNILPVTRVGADWLRVASPCDPDPMDAPIRGDILALFDENFRYLGSARVKALSGSSCTTLTMMLDHPISGVTQSSLVYDLTQQPSARTIIQHNSYHDNRGHGVLVSTPYAEITDNLFNNNSATAILGPSGYLAWPGATNLVISDNEISHSGGESTQYGAVSLIAEDAANQIIATPIFQKIKMVHNRVHDVPGPAVVVTSGESIRLADDDIRNANQSRSAPVTYGKVPSTDSVVLYRVDHATICGTLRSGKTTGPIGIDPTDKKVLVANSCR
jgi:hypothetical protein